MPLANPFPFGFPSGAMATVSRESGVGGRCLAVRRYEMLLLCLGELIFGTYLKRQGS